MLQKGNNRTTIILITCLFLFILLYNLTGLFGVNGVSMTPTLKNNDLLFVMKTKSIDYNDIVIIDSEDVGSDIVKRVIGLPGDKIVINKDGLYRNGELLSEESVSSSDWYSVKRPSEGYVVQQDWYKRSNAVNTTVPADSIFVLGDNRLESYDSRELGNIKLTSVVGVSVCNLSDFTGLSVYGFRLVSAIILAFILFWYLSHRSRVNEVAREAFTYEVPEEPDLPEDVPEEVPAVQMVETPESTVAYWGVKSNVEQPSAKLSKE